MKKLVLLLVVFLLHVEAIDDTQVGTFDSGVSSEKVKLGKRYKTPIKNAETYDIDINEGEVEGITEKTIEPKKDVDKIEKPIEVVQQETNSTIKDTTEASSQELAEKSSGKNEDVVMATQKSIEKPIEAPAPKEVVEKKPEIKVKSDVSQSEGGGVILPFDKVDEKTGVVLPADEKEKGGFFSFFGF